jgi:hypothetical protein
MHFGVMSTWTRLSFSSKHTVLYRILMTSSLASEAQLAAICQTLLQRPMLAQHMCNADAVELPRVASE